MLLSGLDKKRYSVQRYQDSKLSATQVYLKSKKDSLSQIIKNDSMHQSQIALQNVEQSLLKTQKVIQQAKKEKKLSNIESQRRKELENEQKRKMHEHWVSAIYRRHWIEKGRESPLNKETMTIEENQDLLLPSQSQRNSNMTVDDQKDLVVFDPQSPRKSHISSKLTPKPKTSTLNSEICSQNAEFNRDIIQKQGSNEQNLRKAQQINKKRPTKLLLLPSKKSSFGDKIAVDEPSPLPIDIKADYFSVIKHSNDLLRSSFLTRYSQKKLEDKIERGNFKFKPKYDNDEHMCFDLEDKNYIHREEEDLTYLTKFNVNRPVVEHKATVARSVSLKDTNNTRHIMGPGPLNSIANNRKLASNNWQKSSITQSTKNLKQPRKDQNSFKRSLQSMRCVKNANISKEINQNLFAKKENQRANIEADNVSQHQVQSKKVPDRLFKFSSQRQSAVGKMRSQSTANLFNKNLQNKNPRQTTYGSQRKSLDLMQNNDGLPQYEKQSVDQSNNEPVVNSQQSITLMDRVTRITTQDQTVESQFQTSARSFFDQNRIVKRRKSQERFIEDRKQIQRLQKVGRDNEDLQIMKHVQQNTKKLLKNKKSFQRGLNACQSDKNLLYSRLTNRMQRRACNDLLNFDNSPEPTLNDPTLEGNNKFGSMLDIQVDQIDTTRVSPETIRQDQAKLQNTQQIITIQNQQNSPGKRKMYETQTFFFRPESTQSTQMLVNQQLSPSHKLTKTNSSSSIQSPFRAIKTSSNFNVNRTEKDQELLFNSNKMSAINLANEYVKDQKAQIKRRTGNWRFYPQNMQNSVADHKLLQSQSQKSLSIYQEQPLLTTKSRNSGENSQGKTLSNSGSVMNNSSQTQTNLMKKNMQSKRKKSDDIDDSFESADSFLYSLSSDSSSRLQEHGNYHMKSLSGFNQSQQSFNTMKTSQKSQKNEKMKIIRKMKADLITTIDHMKRTKNRKETNRQEMVQQANQTTNSKLFTTNQSWSPDLQEVIQEEENLSSKNEIKESTFQKSQSMHTLNLTSKLNQRDKCGDTEFQEMQLRDRWINTNKKVIKHIQKRHPLVVVPNKELTNLDMIPKVDIIEDQMFRKVLPKSIKYFKYRQPFSEKIDQAKSHLKYFKEITKDKLRVQKDLERKYRKKIKIESEDDSEEDHLFDEISPHMNIQEKIKILMKKKSQLKKHTLINNDPEQKPILTGINTSRSTKLVKNLVNSQTKDRLFGGLQVKIPEGTPNLHLLNLLSEQQLLELNEKICAQYQKILATDKIKQLNLNIVDTDPMIRTRRPFVNQNDKTLPFEGPPLQRKTGHFRFEDAQFVENSSGLNSFKTTPRMTLVPQTRLTSRLDTDFGTMAEHERKTTFAQQWQQSQQNVASKVSSAQRLTDTSQPIDIAAASGESNFQNQRKMFEFRLMSKGTTASATQRFSMSRKRQMISELEKKFRSDDVYAELCWKAVNQALMTELYQFKKKKREEKKQVKIVKKVQIRQENTDEEQDDERVTLESAEPIQKQMTGDGGNQRQVRFELGKNLRRKDVLDQLKVAYEKMPESLTKNKIGADELLFREAQINYSQRLKTQLRQIVIDNVHFCTQRRILALGATKSFEEQKQKIDTVKDKALKVIKRDKIRNMGYKKYKQLQKTESQIQLQREQEEKQEIEKRILELKPRTEGHIEEYMTQIHTI